MKPLKYTFAALAAALLSTSVFAADPTGSWKTTDRDNGGRTDILDIVRFEFKDGRLIGTVEGIDRMDPKVRNSDFAIVNPTFKDGVVTFGLKRLVKRLISEGVQPVGGGAAIVSREIEDDTRVSHYEAKLEGDTLKGTVERIGRNGKPHKVDWSAKLLK